MKIEFSSELLAGTILEILEEQQLHSTQIMVPDAPFSNYDTALYVPGDEMIREWRLWGAAAISCGLIDHFKIEICSGYALCDKCHELLPEYQLTMIDEHTRYCSECKSFDELRIAEDVLGDLEEHPF